MPIIIETVERGSPAWKNHIKKGDMLVSINGNIIRDVLDYRFYMTDEVLNVKLLDDGKIKDILIHKSEYQDLGLDFETYLMDKQQHCSNKCIFCFIDQLPKGLRESLYFKDDDSRMSFLTGSYVTLTNMSKEDIARIIKMHISPINISVHTTNPELRQMMLKNPNSGPSLKYLDMLAEGEIQMNAQLVLCPGVNDGEELRRSLYDLEKYYPHMKTIALVPLGITTHREGLHPLKVMTREQARSNIQIADAFGEEMFQKHGTRIGFVADEMYIIAELDMPEAPYYEDFDQLEDGVGVFALQKKDITEEIEYAKGSDIKRHVSIGCGLAAEPLMKELTGILKEKYPNVEVSVYGVENKLFGETINVTGLLCGNDLYNGLKDKDLGDKLLLASVMLRHQTERFLDDTTVSWLAEKLGIEIQIVEVDGAQLFAACTGESLDY